MQTDSFVDENSNPLEADPGLGHRPDGDGRDRMVDRDAISGAHRLTGRGRLEGRRSAVPRSELHKRCDHQAPGTWDRRLHRDDVETPTLYAFGLNEGKQVSIDLPGRARWCVTDAEAKHVAVTSVT